MPVLQAFGGMGWLERQVTEQVLGSRAKRVFRWMVRGGLTVWAAALPMGEVHAENELIHLKLQDGSQVSVLHVETRQNVLVGKVGAINAQFPQEKISDFKVPAVEEALNEANSLLTSLDNARFEQIQPAKDRMEAVGSRLKDFKARLKWLAPSAEEPIPGLEEAAARISEILKIAQAAEAAILELGSGSGQERRTSEKLAEKIGRIDRAIAEIPFPEKQEDLRRRLQTIERKLQLAEARENSPFFSRARSLEGAKIDQAAYEELATLAQSVDDPDLKGEASALLDRLKMRLPTPTPGSPSSERKSTSQVAAAGGSASEESEQEIGAAGFLNPKVIGFGGAVAVLLVLMPILMRGKGVKQGKAKSLDEIGDAPRSKQMEASKPETPPVVRERPQPPPKPETPPQFMAPSFSEPEFLSAPPLVEELLPAVESYMEPEIPSPRSEGNPLALDGAEAAPPPEAAPPVPQPAMEDLDQILLSESFSETESEEPIYSGAENGFPPPSARTVQSENVGVNLPSRDATEDLFDALERTIEARLSSGAAKPPRGVEEQPSTPPPLSDLEEPQVSLGGVFGFEPDISQFIDESPPPPPPVVLPERPEEVGDDDDSEMDWLSPPTKSVSPVEGEFKIQIGSGYDSFPPIESLTPYPDAAEPSPEESSPAPSDPLADVDPVGTSTENQAEKGAEESDEEVICPLTGVFTREFFDRQFPKVFERSRRDRDPLTVVLVRLDDPEGLMLEDGGGVARSALSGAADILRKAIRTRDILARFDERTFAVLMLQSKPTGAFPLTLKIRNDFKRLNLTAPSGDPIELTASFGMNCLLVDDRTSSPEDLLAGCRDSLELAASRGGNQIVLHGVEGGT